MNGSSLDGNSSLSQCAASLTDGFCLTQTVTHTGFGLGESNFQTAAYNLIRWFQTFLRNHKGPAAKYADKKNGWTTQKGLPSRFFALSLICKTKEVSMIVCECRGQLATIPDLVPQSNRSKDIKV